MVLICCKVYRLGICAYQSRHAKDMADVVDHYVVHLQARDMTDNNRAIRIIIEVGNRRLHMGVNWDAVRIMI